jgi:hypothetical protein
MRRRDFIMLIGGAAAVGARPVGAFGEQPGRIRRIGLPMTMAETAPEAQARLASFRGGLQQLGWTEGHNVKIDYRFAAGDPERLQSSAAELVRLAPDVILANGTAILAALRQEAKNIPIVFVLVPDPVGDGFVESVARPGGNITGLTNFEFPMAGKWVELLKEIAPRTSRVALVFNPETAPYAPRFLQFAARGAEAALTPVRNGAEIERALGEAGDQVEQWPDDPARPVHGGPSRTDSNAGRTIPFACDLSVSAFRGSRQPSLLWRRYARPLSPVGILYRSYSKRREAWRTSGRGADKVRNGDQSQNCEKTRPRHPPATSAARR